MKDAPECDALIDPEQASVFIKFRRLAKAVPLGSDEGEERIWLVLKNNTRWTIDVRAFGVPEDYDGAEAGLMYEVEADGPYEPDQPVPRGYWFDVGPLIAVQPGGELRFSVPREHLAPALAIRVDFTFEWERNKRYTRHSTVFGYWDLPEKLRDRQREKRLKPRFAITAPADGAQFQTSPIPSLLPSSPPKK